MKIRRNWKLWGLVFLFFAGVWFWQASNVAYYKAAPPMAPAPAPDMAEKMPESGNIPKAEMPPPPPAKESVDWWSYFLKFSMLMTGFKTLLDIIDKLKKRQPPNHPNQPNVNVTGNGNIIIIINQLKKVMSQFLTRGTNLFRH